MKERSACKDHMVNIFTKKNKKADVVDDHHVRNQANATTGGALGADKPGVSSVDELPQLRDHPAAKREVLFDQKLELCSHVFNFEDATQPKLIK